MKAARVFGDVEGARQQICRQVHQSCEESLDGRTCEVRKREATRTLWAAGTVGVVITGLLSVGSTDGSLCVKMQNPSKRVPKEY